MDEYVRPVAFLPSLFLFLPETDQLEEPRIFVFEDIVVVFVFIVVVERKLASKTEAIVTSTNSLNRLLWIQF